MPIHKPNNSKKKNKKKQNKKQNCAVDPCYIKSCGFVESAQNNSGHIYMDLYKMSKAVNMCLYAEPL